MQRIQNVLWLFLVPTISFGPQTVGTGGDPLDALIARGRFFAADIVRTAEPQFFNSTPSPKLQQLIDRRDELANDILTSPYVWTTHPQDKCAATLTTSQNTISFSREKCLESHFDAEVAAELLIHESIHHLGTESEDLAPLLARAFMESMTNNPQMQTVIYQQETVATQRTSEQKHTVLWLPYLGADGITKNLSILLAEDTKPNSEGTALYWLDASANRQHWNKTPQNHLWAQLPIRQYPTFTTFVKDRSPQKDEDKILIWGGVKQIFSNAVFRFQSTGAIVDPITGEFENISDVNAPAGRMQHTGVVFGQKFLVWGGLVYKPNLSPLSLLADEAKSTNDGAIYDIAQKTWSLLKQSSTTPSERYGHASATTDSGLFIWGGCGGGEDGTGTSFWRECGYLDNVARCDGAFLDFSTMAWETLPPSPLNCTNPLGATAVSSGDQVFIWNEGSAAIYNTKLKTWTAVPGLREGRQFARVFWIGDTVVLAGGQYFRASGNWNEAQPVAESILIYNTKKQKWDVKVFAEKLCTNECDVIYNGLEAIFVSRGEPADRYEHVDQLYTTFVNIHH